MAEDAMSQERKPANWRATILEVLAYAAAGAGVGLAVDAFQLPERFSLEGASAIQITQVYSQATYSALLAVVAFCGAAAVGILAWLARNRE
jgi:hypothetical protein